MAQLAKTVKDVTLFGVCSKSKHDALKGAVPIDYLIERGTDYSSEVRKYVNDITCRERKKKKKCRIWQLFIYLFIFTEF